jgi:dCTP diphosphatase
MGYNQDMNEVIIMEEIKEILRKFNEERYWEQFHTPENLAKSISIEAAEVLECFQWDNSYDKRALTDEIADVMCYCIMLADEIDIDLKEEIISKIKRNAVKYPVEKSRGSSAKYDEL